MTSAAFSMLGMASADLLRPHVYQCCIGSSVRTASPAQTEVGTLRIACNTDVVAWLGFVSNDASSEIDTL